MWPVGPEQDGTIYLDNLRTRHLGWATPVVDPGEYQPIADVDGKIIYVTGRGVLATDAETGRTRLLGRTVYFAPSGRAGHIWIMDDVLGRREVVRLVPVGAGRPGSPIMLPRGTELIAGTKAGLLLTAGNGLELWSPGSTARTLPHSQAAQGFTVSPRRGTNGWVPDRGFDWSLSAIAPSGTLLAAKAVVPPDSRGITREFVLRLSGQDRRATPVPSSAAFLLAATTWSVGSSWVFYQGPGERMWAYEVSTGEVRSSTTPCCQYATMATLRSRSR